MVGQLCGVQLDLIANKACNYMIAFRRQRKISLRGIGKCHFLCEKVVNKCERILETERGKMQ